MKNILFAASGEGTTVQAFLNQREAGILTVPIVGLIANKTCTAVQRVLDAKLPALVLEPREKEPRAEYDQRFMDAAKQLGADPRETVIILAGYMRILSARLIDEWTAGVLNVHPSLLPKHRGLMDLAVHEAVLKAKETISGCTIHRASVTVDGGPIVLQATCSVHEEDSAKTLRDRVKEKEQLHYPRAVQQLFDGSLAMPPL